MAVISVSSEKGSPYNNFLLYIDLQHFHHTPYLMCLFVIVLFKMGKSKKLVMWLIFSCNSRSMSAFPPFSMFFQEYFLMIRDFFFFRNIFCVSVLFEKLFRNVFEMLSKKRRQVYSLLNTVKQFFFTLSIYFPILFHHYQGLRD